MSSIAAAWKPWATKTSCAAASNCLRRAPRERPELFRPNDSSLAYSVQSDIALAVGLTHRQAYKPIFMLAVVTPIITKVVAIVLAMAMY